MHVLALAEQPRSPPGLLWARCVKPRALLTAQLAMLDTTLAQALDPGFSHAQRWLALPTRLAPTYPVVALVTQASGAPLLSRLCRRYTRAFALPAPQLILLRPR